MIDQEKTSMLKDTISEAVRLALLEKAVDDHDSRLKSLEAFRWWIMTSTVFGALSSAATLLLFVLEHHAK